MGDIDGDSCDDFFSYDPYSNEMVIFGSDGGGASWWYELPFAPTGECALAKGAAIRDLNGDGRMDLLLTGSTRDCAQGGRDSRAAIWWALGLGGRQFSELHIYHGAEGGEFSDIDLADLDGDGALDAAVRYFDGSLYSTTLLRYEPATGSFDPLPGALPAGTPTFSKLDGDARWDLLLADVGGTRTQVYRGLGSGQFELVQELAGAGQIALGPIFVPTGRDLIAVNNHGPDIMVWRNMIQTASVEVPPERAMSVLRVVPSVTSSRAEVRWGGSGRPPFAVRVFDASGRSLLSRSTQDRSWIWDLKSDGGQSAHPGIYWIRMADSEGRAETGKIAIVR